VIEKMHTGFWWGNVRERDHLEDPGLDGIMLRWIFRKLDGSMDYVGLVQDGDKWRALLNAVMNLQVPQMWGIS
jgi:hypothetical protein